jgi:hypothetical protein
MKIWERPLMVDRSATHVSQSQVAAPMPPCLVYLVTTHDLRNLHSVLARGSVPPDFEAKLARLAKGNLVEQYVEHNSRLFVALLHAAHDGWFRLTAAERDRLLRVLAYVRKDDDAIPDYRPGGFVDDQRELRATMLEFGHLLQSFKAWRLCHQVPAMWSS